MFTNVPCDPHYLHGTHLSLIEFRINLLKHVDCNQVDGDCNELHYSQYSFNTSRFYGKRGT